MRLFKLIKLMSMIAIMILIISCDPKDETQEIYGTFVGTATQTMTTILDSEELSNLTESATLNLTKVKDGMNLEIIGEKIYSKVSNLPALEVSGNSDYQYTYSSKDGNAEITITSPNFDNISVNYTISYEDDDRKFEYSFYGKRI